MMCEQAEGYLSAYLDDMLEPEQRADVSAHLETCAECRAELADYRHFDQVLAAAPRRAPTDELHARIFESPEYARLLRRLERAEHGHSPLPLPLPLFATRKRNAPAPAEEQPDRPASRPQSPPRWRGGAWRVAAALALVVGSALLIKQGLLHSGTTIGQSTPRTIAGPDSGAPLAAGPRAVFLHDGTLWSAPESGAGIAQRLTPAAAHVGAWTVSPGGRLVAYVDTVSGRLHIIRSDSQSDHVVGSAGGIALSVAPAWSPDGAHIAYVARAAGRQSTLHLMNADGSNDVAVGSRAESTGAPVWSDDSLRIAYTQTTRGTQSLWTYGLDTKRSQQLAAQADDADAQAVIDQLAWLPDPEQPGVTWSARVGNQITGIFHASLVGSGAAVRLTPAGTAYAAAGYSAGHGGIWLLASAPDAAGSPTLTALPVTAPVTAASVATTSPVHQVAVSPDGGTVAYVTANDALFIWSPGRAPVRALNQVSGAPVWSPDGTRLAVQANGAVLSVAVSQGAVGPVVRLAAGAGVVAIQWSPDGNNVAITSAGGVMLVSADGAQSRLVDAHPAESAIVWTVAG